MGQFLKLTGTYGIATAMQPMLSLLLVPLYARVLTTAEFGELAIIMTVKAFLEMVVGLQLSSSIVKIYHDYPAHQRRDALSTCFVMVIVSSAGIVGVLLLLNRLTGVAALVGIQQRDVFDMMLVSIPLSAVIAVVMGGLRAQQRAKVFVIVAVVGSVATLLAKVFFVAVLRQGVLGAIRGVAVGGLLGCVVACGFTLMGSERWGWKFSVDTLKANLRFGLPLVPTGFLNWVQESAPRYFLLWFGSEVAVGQLSLAKGLVGPVSLLLLNPIKQAWAPMVYSVRDREKQRYLIAEGTYGIVAILFSVGVVISVFRQEIVNIILSARHAGVTNLLPLFVLALVIREAVMPLGIGINLKSRTELHSLGFLVSTIVVVLSCAVLAPKYGVWGAAIAIVLSSIGMLAVYGVAVKMVFPLSLSYAKLGGIGLLWLVFFIAGEMLVGTPIWISLLSRGLLCGFFPVLIYTTGCLGPIGVRARTTFLDVFNTSDK